MDPASLLRLQVEWGADEALDDTPRDRLAQPPVRAKPSATLAPALSHGDAASLEALHAALAAFEGCALKATATHLVFGAGAATAGLVIVGEAPDRESDRTGDSFAGPAGAMVEQWLASIGLSREAARLTFLVPWRPPGGRAPTEAEISACLPFLHRQIALLQPRMLLLLGTLPGKTLLGIEVARRRLGWHKANLAGLEIPAIQVPAIERVLRDATAKQAAWAQLIRLRRALDNNAALTPL